MNPSFKAAILLLLSSCINLTLADNTVYNTVTLTDTATTVVPVTSTKTSTKTQTDWLTSTATKTKTKTTTLTTTTKTLTDTTTSTSTQIITTEIAPATTTSISTVTQTITSTMPQDTLTSTKMVSQTLWNTQTNHKTNTSTKIESKTKTTTIKSTKTNTITTTLPPLTHNVTMTETSTAWSTNLVPNTAIAPLQSQIADLTSTLTALEQNINSANGKQLAAINSSIPGSWKDRLNAAYRNAALNSQGYLPLGNGSTVLSNGTVIDGTPINGTTGIQLANGTILQNVLKNPASSTGPSDTKAIDMMAVMAEGMMRVLRPDVHVLSAEQIIALSHRNNCTIKNQGPASNDVFGSIPYWSLATGDSKSTTDLSKILATAHIPNDGAPSLASSNSSVVPQINANGTVSTASNVDSNGNPINSSSVGTTIGKDGKPHENVSDVNVAPTQNGDTKLSWNDF